MTYTYAKKETLTATTEMSMVSTECPWFFPAMDIYAPIWQGFQRYVHSVHALILWSNEKIFKPPKKYPH